MNEEKKKEFFEKFVEKIRNGDEYDGDFLTDDPDIVWKWIDSELKQARIDELEKLIGYFTDDLDNATIFQDATRAYGLEYARISVQNELKELEK